jgi:tRNA-specific 2-thiouridylase
MKRRVVVALSGGVDSSTAATILVERGHEVIGVMLRLWPALSEAKGSTEGGAPNRCCTPEGVEDARRVCQLLGIPFYLLNAEDEFKARVVNPFTAAYLAGRTPNPCLDCNRHIKFGLLLRHALALDAEYLATGHYTRVCHVDGEYQLLKGIDPAKDQSYALYMLGQDELRHILWPLGELTKAQVREIALAHRLPVANRPESQELCFVAQNDYREFLEIRSNGAIRLGPILDRCGRELGQHRGLAFYTVGQRKGLGIAAGEPLYVLELDAAHNAVIVGREEELGRREVLAEEVSFVWRRPPEGPIVVTAKIRYKAAEAAATLEVLDGHRARVTFAEPQRAVAPGQGIVFYQGERCLGGGIIG